MKLSANLYFPIVVAICILLTACGGGAGNGSAITHQSPSPAPPAPASAATLQAIALSPSTASLPLGRNQQLTATGSYSDSSTKDLSASVTWTSSNEAVATVSNSGLVTSKSQGSATFTATSAAVTGSASILVTAPVVSSMTVSPGGASVPLGAMQGFTATVELSDGTTQEVTQSAIWSSSDTTVAIIDKAVLTARKLGSTTVTASFGSSNSTAAVAVIAPALQSINIIPGSASLAIGQSQQFAAYGIYTDNSQQDLTALVAWSSTDSAVATVSADGLAESVSTGDVSLTATYNSIIRTAALQVTPAVLTAVTISPDLPSVAAGGFQQFTATGDFSDGTSQDITDGVTWSSDHVEVAAVTSGGWAAGLSAGSTNITGCVGSVCDSTQLTITPATLISIDVTPLTASIAKGTTQQFTAIATFSDGSSSDITAGASWSSSAPSVASISAIGSANGLEVGNGITITATSGSISGTATLEVTGAVLGTIAVTPAMPVVGTNATQQFTATGLYSDGSAEDLSTTVTWTSSSASIATITNTGLATAVAKGDAEISAAYGSIKGSTVLSVTDVTLIAITVNNSSTSAAPPTVLPLAIGKQSKLQFYAWGAYSDGSNRRLTGITWVSSKPSVASVNGSGVVRSKRKADTVNISAIFGGIFGSVQLKVTAAALQSVSISPATASIAPGTMQQFVLTGTYGDGSMQDLTGLAYWRTSSAAVATVNKGVATAVATGMAMINADYKGLSAAPATLTVTNATLDTITITPPNPNIILGGAQQFTATGNFSDATQQDLTLLVHWTSSDPAVAVINAKGLATTAGRGTTAIAATFRSVGNVTVLIVN